MNNQIIDKSPFCVTFTKEIKVNFSNELWKLESVVDDICYLSSSINSQAVCHINDLEIDLNNLKIILKNLSAAKGNLEFKSFERNQINNLGDKFYELTVKELVKLDFSQDQSINIKDRARKMFKSDGYTAIIDELCKTLKSVNQLG